MHVEDIMVTFKAIAAAATDYFMFFFSTGQLRGRHRH